MPVVGTVKEKDLDKVEFVLLPADVFAAQLALGAELELHPVRGDLVAKSGLVEIDPLLLEHGVPPRVNAPDKVKELYSKQMVASREDELAHLQKSKEDEGKAVAKAQKEAGVVDGPKAKEVNKEADKK